MDCSQFIAGLNLSKQVDELINHAKDTDKLNQSNVYLSSDSILDSQKMLLTHERLYELAFFKFSNRARRNNRDNVRRAKERCVKSLRSNDGEDIKLMKSIENKLSQEAF